MAHVGNNIDNSSKIVAHNPVNHGSEADSKSRALGMQITALKVARLVVPILVGVLVTGCSTLLGVLLFPIHPVAGSLLIGGGIGMGVVSYGFTLKAIDDTISELEREKARLDKQSHFAAQPSAAESEAVQVSQETEPTPRESMKEELNSIFSELFCEGFEVEDIRVALEHFTHGVKHSTSKPKQFQDLASIPNPGLVRAELKHVLKKVPKEEMVEDAVFQEAQKNFPTDGLIAPSVV